jgi:hypothetical protein
MRVDKILLLYAFLGSVPEVAGVSPQLRPELPWSVHGK